MLQNIKTAYFIGIKGVGMTALAQILHNKGIKVWGSDIKEKFFTDKILKKLKIKYIEGFNANNIPKEVDLVITSVAYLNKNNPEINRVKKLKLPLYTYPQVLAELFNKSYGIAIAGSHGKSTTTAMLGYILEQAGFDPTVVVGSRVNQWGSNSRLGRSRYFIIEADEYRDAFLQYKPKMAVVTNIDYDHPDYFKNAQQYQRSFDRFIGQPSIEKIVTSTEKINYKKFNLKILGEYNNSNAALAYKAALKLGVNPQVARKAVENFKGIARRFEYYGQFNDAKLYDDYAHHPTEIKAVITACRQKFPNKKIIVLFQPHTYSRTEGLFDNFIKALQKADEAHILKTYASAREYGQDKSGEELAKKLNAKYFKNHKEAAKFFKKKLNSNYVFLALGAGNQWQILEFLLVE